MSASPDAVSVVPVHIVSGFLGAGKTTLIRRQLALRGAQSPPERCAVLVNDFGVASFDATLLDGGVGVINIPGGCVCCTAPEGMVPALQSILDELKPDRIFIEPTGLARPADLVDTLERSPIAGRITVTPVAAVVDPNQLISDTPPVLLLEQIDAAAILIANRIDTASAPALAAFRQQVTEHWPEPLGVWEVSQGEVPPEVFELRWADAPPPGDNTDSDDHDHDHSSTEGYAAASGAWSADITFDVDRLKSLLRTAGLTRGKGLFRTDIGWYRLERAGDAVHAAPTAYRGGSRLDIIVAGSQEEAQALIDRISGLTWTPPRDAEPVVRLRDAEGREVELTRLALAALPGQVSDVSALIPGREGRGVYLREVLSLVGPETTYTFVVSASDGMSTEPVSIDGAGEAVLVHSLADGPFPRDKGGPYRLLIPPGEGRSACANVKKLDRIRIVAG